MRALDAEMVEHGECVVAEMLVGECIGGRHFGWRIAARGIGDAAVGPREIPHLRLPTAIIGRELVNEQDRGTASRLFKVKTRGIPRSDVRHDDLPAGSGVVLAPPPFARSSIAMQGSISYRPQQKKTQDREMLTRIVQAAAILLAGTTALMAEPAYPSRTITLMVAYNAGGSTDLIARVL